MSEKARILSPLLVFSCYRFNKFFHCVFKIFTDFAFPNDNNFPTLFLKLLGNFCKTLFVSFDFVFPKFDVVFGNTRVFAVFVSVPETTVNENDCFEFFQYDIWFFEQILLTQAETKPQQKKQRPHFLFRLCVAGFDFCYNARSFRG